MHQKSESLAWIMPSMVTLVKPPLLSALDKSAKNMDLMWIRLVFSEMLRLAALEEEE
jgi:hypothetical protein